MCTSVHWALLFHSTLNNWIRCLTLFKHFSSSLALNLGQVKLSSSLLTKKINMIKFPEMKNRICFMILIYVLLNVSQHDT